MALHQRQTQGPTHSTEATAVALLLLQIMPNLKQIMYALAQHSLFLRLWHVTHVGTEMVDFLCRHLTCPAENTSCPLCQHNPNRRCHLADNFAPKQLEKQPLLSCCGSSVRIGLTHCNNLWQGPVESCSSSRQAAVQECDEICLEVCAYSCHGPTCCLGGVAACTVCVTLEQMGDHRVAGSVRLEESF